jgi:hypothetical protein
MKHFSFRPAVLGMFNPHPKIQNPKSKIFLLVFSLVLAANVWAQVVIPANRFPTTLGDSFVSFTNRDTVTVNFDPGANSWNFSTGPQTDTSLTVFVPRSRTPHPDSFPLAQLFDRSFLLRDTTSTYLYGNKPPDSLYIYGVSADTGNGQYSVLRMLPDMKVYPFPLQAGVTWTTTDSIPVGTYLGFRVVLFDTNYGRVLKEGTVTVPYGGPTPCLLARSSLRGLIRLRPINLILDTLYQETAEWLVPDWGTVASITSQGKDSTWPITRASSGGFTRLWQLIHVGVEEQTPHAPRPPRLTHYELGPAFPNPMRDRTEISFSYPLSLTPYPFTLSIYDPTGRLIRVLRSYESGVTSHSFLWDGRDDAGQPVGSGVYFYRLEAGSFSATQKLVVVR